MDPRDQTWQHDATRFRVYFRSHPDRSDEWELDSTDVRDVIAWAEDQRPLRGDYVLYAVVPGHPPELGLVQIAGTDPTVGRRRSAGPRQVPLPRQPLA